MRSSDRMAVAVAVATFLAAFTLTPLTEDSSFLGLSWLLIILLAVVSVILRRTRLGSPGVLAAQLAVLAGFLGLVATGLPGGGETALEHLGLLWRSALAHIQTQAAPMAANAGVKLLFTGMVGAIAILTDLLAVGLARPPWALAPPATLFLVPAIGLGTDTGLVNFACIALGYLGILLAEGLNTTARWTRGLSRDSADAYGTATPVVWRAGAYLAGPALLLTAVLGGALPTLALPGWGWGAGSGGSGPLQLTDPTLDLRRNLTQPADVQVIEYTSDAPGGMYLRMASLPQFNGSGWTNVQMRLDEGHELPQIPGVSAEPGQRRNSTIKVLDLRSEYLPLPYAPRRFTAKGDWAYDTSSLVVLSTARRDRAEATRNLTYTVESVDIAPSDKQLAKALAGTPADAATTAAVPRDLPEDLIKLSQKVTADADTPAAKAAAIQAYLRSGDFTYSTEQLPGTGYRALQNFLLKDHRGYCEQFAGAMAMMARVAGIPSRVAVGFLPGKRSGGAWKVTAHDMHSWPELYFAGFGWVRFEPTPASVTGSPPAWTVPEVSSSEESSTAPNDVPSSRASAPSSGPNVDAPTQQPVDAEAPAAPSTLKVVGSASLGLLVLAILAAPATIRVRRRSSRLAGKQLTAEQVEAAWAEIRDTVWDYGGSWPDGSPRVVGGEIGRRLDQEESRAMSQVAVLVERARYARTPPDEQAAKQLPEWTSRVRRGLAEPQSRWRRTLAVVAPRSLLKRRRP